MRCILFAATVALTGCIHAPDIVVLDRATALEREAAGQYPRLDLELQQAGTAARPAALTREQLEDAGHPRPVIEELAPSDAERIDALLKDNCVGEALDGTLAETRDRCAMKQVPHLSTLVERTNRDRVQMWEWLKAARPQRSMQEVRQAWREVHLRGVTCGGQIQRSDGKWEPKKC
jgi:hypothetical protein